MPESLFIRTDASPQIGTGHVMRCLALAQAWTKTGGAVHFVCANITPSLEERLVSEGFQIHKIKTTPGSIDDAAQTCSVARACVSPPNNDQPTTNNSPSHQSSTYQLITCRPHQPTNPSTHQLAPINHQPCPWIIADGYHFGAEYQRAVKRAGYNLLLFDDYGHASHYCADLVLNQNLHASEALYKSREPYTQLLLGTKYVQLRQEFLAYRGWKREIPEIARKVLVTLGGADPDNVTEKVMLALQGLDVEARVIVGGSNPHLPQLQSAAKELSQCELIVDAKNMPELMVWADVAVAAGGTTSWELAFFGVPSLILVLADNQRQVAAVLHDQGIFKATGIENLHHNLQAILQDKALRDNSSRTAKRLVDGSGGARVVTQMNAKLLKLRHVNEGDCRQLWEWANDPVVRGTAIDGHQIAWDEHVQWFSSRLKSRNSVIYIATDARLGNLGQIRFEWDNDGEAEVDVSIDPKLRRRYLGASLIRAGTEKLFFEREVNTIRAFIKPENAASRRAFGLAGFEMTGAKRKGDQALIEYYVRRSDV